MFKGKEVWLIILVIAVMVIGILAINREMTEIKESNALLKEEVIGLKDNISKLGNEIKILETLNGELDTELQSTKEEVVKLLDNISILEGEKKLLLNENVKLKAIPKVSRSSTRTVQAKAPSNPVAKSKAVKSTNAQSTTPKSEKRLLGTFEATAYTDNAQSQGKWVGQTATGMKPQVGVIAVDPRVIPLGTKLYVEGYGNAIAGDTGGAIKGKRVDLFFNTQKECTNYGRRSVKVWVR